MSPKEEAAMPTMSAMEMETQRLLRPTTGACSLDLR
jgi:hypothetical protein